MDEDAPPARAELLAGIRRRRAEFEAAGERAEQLRTLPGEAVRALRELGAFWLKTPAELGGTPLPPLDFCDVMEAPESVHIAVATASVYAAETCAAVITDLFRYGGGRVLSLSSPVQRLLRDVLAARQHIALSEENYERAGRAYPRKSR